MLTAFKGGLSVPFPFDGPTTSHTLAWLDRDERGCEAFHSMDYDPFIAPAIRVVRDQMVPEMA